MCLNVSRYRLLESRLEETVQQTMKVKEEKICSLEKKLEESSALNKTLHAELEAVRKRALAFASVNLKLCDSHFSFPLQARQTASASHQQHEEVNHNFQQHPAADRSATAELLRIKDHLIDVEKNVSRCF